MGFSQKGRFYGLEESGGGGEEVTKEVVNSNYSSKRTLIQRPYKLKPWGEQAGTKNQGGVWISMKPNKILDQYSKGAGAISSVEGTEEFLFLAPLALNEQMSHTWEEYESVASRLAQKVRSVSKLTAETRGLVEVFGKGASIDSMTSNVKQLVANSSGVGRAIESVSRQVYNKTGGHSIPKIKIDTPSYYTSSERRQLVIDFQLFNEPISPSNPEESLITPIKKLMKYSSPEHNGGIDIEFPYFFEVKTVPVPFIYMPTCALTGIIPIWSAPYVKGVPSSVSLQLTFKDLSPLYRQTITKGTIINVISSNNSNAKLAKGQTPTIKNFKPTNTPNSQDAIRFKKGNPWGF
jgi:hypothetical protein